jgi:sugar phosphate isomerase/epimerase
MKPEPPGNISRLCIHTITTKPLSIETAINKYITRGVRGITVWRDAYDGFSAGETGKMIRNSGLEVVSLCRGGFFPSADENKRKAAIADNRAALEEASDMGAPLLVLVCGADPRQPLEVSRDQIREGIETILPLAEKLKIRLAIEPLHPVYADTRSAITTLEQANDLAEHFASPFAGVALDVYHLWWDPHLESEITRCGNNNNIFAFHICDWKVPTVDVLLDRGIMGEGCINIRQIRGWVNSAGFDGYDEVEIFSEIHWKSDQDEYLDKIVEAYRLHVQ